MKTKNNRRVILGVTAGIAIYKACDLLRRLREQQCSVTVVMTKEAEELIRPVVFASLSGNRVYRGLFNEPDTWEIEHISLAQQADVVVIAPATANIIAKISAGVCDDLLTCVVCATKAPVVICPAMNTGMYTNRIVRENIKKLKNIGYVFVGPREGRLACGDTGVGCLAEVESIVQHIKKLL